MSKSVIAHGHTIIGGIASQYQSFIARELAFSALYDRHTPATECFGQVIGVVDNASEGSEFIRTFDAWRKARGKTPRHIAYLSLDDIRTSDELIRRVDRVWRHVPIIFVRDLSGHQHYPNDLWLSQDAPELLAIYASGIVTAVNTGPHKVASTPLADYPADARWLCETDGGANVTMKNVATNEVHRFRGRNIGGQMIFDAVEKEGPRHD